MGLRAPDPRSLPSLAHRLALAALLLQVPGCAPNRPAERPAETGAGQDRFADLRGRDRPAPFRFPGNREEGPADPGRPARVESGDRPEAEQVASPEPLGPLEGGAVEVGRDRATDPLEADPLAPVASFRCTAPSRQPFVLHGTLPVPAGFPEPDQVRMAIVDRWAEGALRPAQLEVVARRSTGEPQVIEVSARITAPPAPRPLEASYALVLLEGREAAPLGKEQALPPDALLAQAAGRKKRGEPAGVWLRTRDVFGNEYAAELTGSVPGAGLGSVRTLSSGPSLHRRRVHSALVPSEVSGQGPALPHLLSAHAYWTHFAGDGRLGLDLRIHNGLTAGSQIASEIEEPAGIVYWEYLELVIPPGWTLRHLLRDPALGPPRREDGSLVVPLVAPMPDGTLQVMGPQAQMLRRLELVQAGATSDDQPPIQTRGLGFCEPGDELWSWWNPRTAAFMPQRVLLADWGRYRRDGRKGQAALRHRLEMERQVLTRALQAGVPAGLVAGARMGWAHPLGASVQGMTGGWGIQFVEGHRTASAMSVTGIEVLMLEQRMTACRQPESQWNLAGEPVSVDLWLDERGRIPFDFRTHGRVVPPEFALPCRGGPPASEHVLEVVRKRRRPPWDRGTEHKPDGQSNANPDNLLGWWPHDGQHLSRVTRTTKALVWLANDPLARDELMHTAGLFHLMFHEHPHIRASWSPGTTLRIHEEVVAAHPHQGLSLGRDQAWGIDAMCAAYSIAPPSWRSQRLDWFRRVGQLMVDAAMPSGLIQRIQISKILGGRYASSQAFECAFLLHAERALLESVLRGVDPELVQQMEEQYLRAVDYLFEGPVYECIDDPRAGRQCGPRWHFAVAPDAEYRGSPYCDSSVWGPGFLPEGGRAGGVETLYALATLEYAYLLSRDVAGGLDNPNLRRALELGSQAGTWPKFVSDLWSRSTRDTSEASDVWEGLLARLQELGVGFR